MKTGFKAQHPSPKPLNGGFFDNLKLVTALQRESVKALIRYNVTTGQRDERPGIHSFSV